MSDKTKTSADAPESIEVLLTPADFENLKGVDLSRTTTVVFDVLRATTSMITALSNGAQAIIPVATIEEALELRRQDPATLLAGERDGVRITDSLTGSIDFDLGNSPREFAPDIVNGRTIAITTTNGTRALRASLHSRCVYVASLRNLHATARALLAAPPAHLLIICSGTYEQAAYEDTLAAGALCQAVWPSYARACDISDSAQMALWLFQAVASDVLAAFAKSKNGARLLSRPELAADVPFCASVDATDVVVRMTPDGSVRRGP